MPNGHFEYLVDQAKDLGATLISVFGYGEPLLDNGLVKKIRYCTNKNLDTFITTNGSLLTIDLGRQLLDAGLKSIRFSVHGLHNTYETVHKGLDFDDVIRKIGNFNAYSRNGCKISISCIPMSGEKIGDIINFWSNYDIEIWRPHNWAGGRYYRKLDKKKKTCGRPHNGPIQINADGKMMVCCFDTNAEMIVGNTYKQTIEEILKGEEFNKIREKHETGCLDGLPCENCDQLNEDDQALIYSTIDPSCETGKTSSTKFKLKEM